MKELNLLLIDEEDEEEKKKQEEDGRKYIIKYIELALKN
jgi:hypothetical protein